MTEPSSIEPVSILSADQYVGDKVHTLLWRRRLPQRVLMEVLAVDASTVSKKLRGERSWAIDELLAVAIYFGVELTDLLPDPETFTPNLNGRGRGVDRSAARRVAPTRGGRSVTPRGGGRSPLEQPMGDTPRYSEIDDTRYAGVLPLRRAIARTIPPTPNKVDDRPLADVIPIGRAS